MRERAKDDANDDDYGTEINHQGWKIYNYFFVFYLYWNIIVFDNSNIIIFIHIII